MCGNKVGMAIKEFLLRGFTARSFEEVLSFPTVFSLLVIALIGIIAVKTLPKIPYALSGFFKKFLPFKFSKETQKQYSKIITLTIYLALIYSSLYVLGFELIHLNPIFRIILVIYGVKVVIAVLKPFVLKMDSRMEEVHISEGSVLMRLLVVIVCLIGFLVILSIIGLKNVLVASLAGAGVIGIVIGFGAQETVSNTISGIFIALDRPFQIGDIIKINGTMGRVKEMGLRITVVETFDNEVITVPNKKFTSNPVINYTANESRRVKVEVGISYDSDIEKAMEAIKNALNSIEGKVSDKEPEVLIKNFGGSSIDMEGRVWVNQFENSWIKSHSQIREAIIEEFRNKKVSIPFPTRVIIKKD